MAAAMKHAPKSAKNNAAAPSAEFLGLLKPQTLRSSNPKLNAAHLNVCDLLTFVCPRSQLRRPPPVSHTCANVRSHRSLRHRFNWRPLLARTRRRFARKASSYASGLLVQIRLFCRRSGTYVRTPVAVIYARNPFSWDPFFITPFSIFFSPPAHTQVGFAPPQIHR